MLFLPIRSDGFGSPVSAIVRVATTARSFPDRTGSPPNGWVWRIDPGTKGMEGTMMARKSNTGTVPSRNPRLVMGIEEIDGHGMAGGSPPEAIPQSLSMKVQVTSLHVSVYTSPSMLHTSS